MMSLVFIAAFIALAYIFNVSVETLATVLFTFFVTLLIIGFLIKFFSGFVADPPKEPEKPASPATVLSYYDYYIEGIVSRLPGRIAEIKSALAGYRSKRDELQARFDKVTEQLRELGEDWEDDE